MLRQVDGDAVLGPSARRYGDVLRQDDAALDAARPAALQLSNYDSVRAKRRAVRRAWLLGGCFLLALCLGYYGLSHFRLQALAHDAARPNLDNWFMGLKSQGGALCCNSMEAEKLSDPQWDTKDGHYRVFLDDHWLDVPDAAVVDGPNRMGPAMVWPQRYDGKVIGIRCFMPGAGT